jgi:5-methyltetrahydropteroyltriglutamate--homocysteine methyltransferase
MEVVIVKRSTDRVLTTHTGSLPRPEPLRAVFTGQRHADDGAGFAALVTDSVNEIVRCQAEAGVDVLNDGEMSKESYSTYVHERLTGFGGQGEAVLEWSDLNEYPGYLQRWSKQWMTNAGEMLQPPACDGPIGVRDRELLRADIDNLRAAAQGVDAEDVFLSTASPGVIAAFFANHYYPSRDEYLQAIATAMREEYEAIAQAGFVLQLDCPDLAMCRHLQFQHLSTEQFRDQARVDIEMLNEATRNIDPDRMRLHLCWGNYEGPHHKDVPLRDIIDIVFDARPNGILLEAANPRHEHEWQVFEDIKLPEGKLLIPGVIDSTINYIEHPELIAQRLVRYGRLVGRENIMAGSDCGFGTGATTSYVDPEIVWAKFHAMAEGAKLATEQLSHSTIPA